MCVSRRIRYTCGCSKEAEFIQCPERRPTNTKWNQIDKEWLPNAATYCSKHLVKQSAQKKYYDRPGQNGGGDNDRDRNGGGQNGAVAQN